MKELDFTNLLHDFSELLFYLFIKIKHWQETLRHFDGLEAKYYAEVFLFERLLSVLGISVSGSWAMPYGISLALLLGCQTD